MAKTEPIDVVRSLLMHLTDPASRLDPANTIQLCDRAIADYRLSYLSCGVVVLTGIYRGFFAPIDRRRKVSKCGAGNRGLSGGTSDQSVHPY